MPRKIDPGRKCHICGNKETYIDSRGRSQWYKHRYKGIWTGNFECHKCHHNIIWGNIGHISTDKELDILIKNINIEELIKNINPKILLRYIDPNILLKHIGHEILLKHIPYDLLVRYIDINSPIESIVPKAFIKKIDIEILSVIENVTPENILSIPNECGTYIITVRSRKRYVGSSKKVVSRVRTHVHNIIEPIIAIDFYITENILDAKILEYYFIRELCPELNKE